MAFSGVGPVRPLRVDAGDSDLGADDQTLVQAFCGAAQKQAFIPAQAGTHGIDGRRGRSIDLAGWAFAIEVQGLGLRRKDKWEGGSEGIPATKRLRASASWAGNDGQLQRWVGSSASAISAAGALQSKSGRTLARS